MPSSGVSGSWRRGKLRGRMGERGSCDLIRGRGWKSSCGFGIM